MSQFNGSDAASALDILANAAVEHQNALEQYNGSSPSVSSVEEVDYQCP